MGLGEWKLGYDSVSTTAGAPAVSQGVEVVRILSDACRLLAPATILAPNAAKICQGRIAALTTEVVRLDLFEEAPDFRPPTVCCVSFIQGGRARLFLARALEYTVANGTMLARLALEIPSRIAGTEARMAFRIPLAEHAGLQARLSDGGVTWPAVARDISLSGILLRLQSDEDPGWPVGKQLALELRLRADSVDLLAQVRRRLDGTYGMLFPSVVQEGGLAPPEALRRIVRTLDHVWLAERRQPGR